MVVASTIEATFPSKRKTFGLDDLGVKNTNLGCSAKMIVPRVGLVLVVQRVLGRDGPPFYSLPIY